MSNVYPLYMLSGIRADLVCHFCKTRLEVRAEPNHDQIVLPEPWSTFCDSEKFWCGKCDPRGNENFEPATATETFLHLELQNMGYKKLAIAIHGFSVPALKELCELVERAQPKEKK